ncbi:hypothetical protein PU02_0901 [Bartonella ancashensis]|uniref:Uncharacterized protein n=1 Tax=Bartonella ancashensis TaxID=1318743 RepID=A0A0M3T320_9HYPH|nr:hypothetical protein PU02_0901 [Bartonella ancashensis]
MLLERVFLFFIRINLEISCGVCEIFVRNSLKNIRVFLNFYSEMNL